jgi:protein YIPF5/7
MNPSSVEWYSAGPAGAGSYAPPPPAGGPGGGGGGGGYGVGNYGVGAASYGYGAPYGSGMGGGAAGPGGGYGPSTSFDDEPPLLEELGIDLSAIARKSAAVLTHRLSSRALDDGLDMGGALAWALALGALHLLGGKMHFGVVLGWGVLQSVAVWFVALQLRQGSGGGSGAGSGGGGGGGGQGGGGYYGQSPQQQQQQQQQQGSNSTPGGLDLYSVCCVTGYCMLPILLLSVAALLVPPRARGAAPALAGALLAALWSAHLAARVMSRAPAARGTVVARSPALLAYPCFLMYGAFALLTVY